MTAPPKIGMISHFPRYNTTPIYILSGRPMVLGNAHMAAKSVETLIRKRYSNLWLSIPISIPVYPLIVAILVAI